MLGSLAILDWLVIYLLTRKLSEPIKEVANAAIHIVEGNYDIHVDKNIKEQEIHDLIYSFKDMASRLQQLELMRTELLAGVTHELKTPVTSISGLIQAVKDEVVVGEEAKEFLEISTKETYRLQKMLEDLLDFNSFVVGEIRVQTEKQNIGELVKEITHQWAIGQADEGIQINTLLVDEPLYSLTDSSRIQQILYNLLNNAKQAMNGQGKIEVVLTKQNEQIYIEVKDQGMGIPEEEYHLIFERFYRGKEKTNRVRGLGLGLTFSKMAAKALGGDLVLKESSRAGTTFILKIPIRA